MICTLQVVLQPCQERVIRKLLRTASKFQVVGVIMNERKIVFDETSKEQDIPQGLCRSNGDLWRLDPASKVVGGCLQVKGRMAGTHPKSPYC
jgi:hypothetical protein